MDGKERKFRKGNSSGARATREGFLMEVGPEGFSYVEGVVRRCRADEPWNTSYKERPSSQKTSLRLRT